MRPSDTSHHNLWKQLSLLLLVGGIALFMAAKPIVEISLCLADVYCELSDMVEDEESKEEKLKEKISEDTFFVENLLHNNHDTFTDPYSVSVNGFIDLFLYRLEHHLDVPSPPPELV